MELLEITEKDAQMSCRKLGFYHINVLHLQRIFALPEFVLQKCINFVKH